MDDHSQLGHSGAPAENGEPPFLDTVTGRLATVAIVALILAGVIAIVFVLRDRDDASAGLDEPSIAGGFEVTGAEVLEIDPAQITGSCPAEVFFSAVIQTTGAEGTVVYRWNFDDAGPTEPEMAALPPGVPSVTVDLQTAIGGADARFRNMREQVMLQILDQNGEAVALESSKRAFDIACS